MTKNRKSGLRIFYHNSNILVVSLHLYIYLVYIYIYNNYLFTLIEQLLVIDIASLGLTQRIKYLIQFKFLYN